MYAVSGAFILCLVVMLCVPSFANQALAAGCQGVTGLDCECQATCSFDRVAADTIYVKSTQVLPFTSAGCPAAGGHACLLKSEDLCQRVARYLNASNPSSCKDNCNDPDAAISRSVMVGSGLCPDGKTCCLEEATVSPAGSCVNLAGVKGVCKRSPTEQDANLTEIQYWSNMLASGEECPNGSVCTVPRGNEFCKAAAANEGLEGDYVCVSKGDCEKDIAEAAGVLRGQLCPSGQSCCIAKPGAAAAPSGPAEAGTPKTLPDPLGGANIHSIIGNVIKTFSGIVGSIALLMFVYGGIMMILSGGDTTKVANAKKILVNAAIGIVLIFAAYTFVSAIIDAILAE